MESSRIFIKGLPPSLGVEDFKKHFSMHSAITDAKLIPHRRIGYVGYKTPQDAEKAIKYHNKTFIRMSRIAVELARSVEHQHALRPSFNSTNGSKRKYAEIQDEVSSGFVTDGNKKRKYRDLAKEKNEAKLREFLEVMQPPSKSKTWGNQDPVDMRAPTATYLPALDAEAATDLPDDTHDEAVIKKQKNKQEPEHTHDLAAKVRQPTDINHQDKDDNADNDVGLHSDQVCEEATRKPIHHSSTVSDADWLRSRTSRLLGLADDGPVEPVTLPGGDPEENRETSVSLAQERHKHTSNASVQTHVEAEAKEVAGPAPRPQGIEDSSTGNGRLFVRNLTYTATGEDLRRFFESEDQGTIEEVG